MGAGVAGVGQWCRSRHSGLTAVGMHRGVVSPRPLCSMACS